MRKLQAIVCLFILVLTISGCAKNEEAVLNPYLGSNKLDGNGIPSDFFQDVHIRRAFAYCFDWQPIVDDVYMV
jgi:ABC-type transport system substrate-binding protein